MGMPKLYADLPARRTLQVAGDAALVAWVVFWIVVARVVREAVLQLAVPGEKLASGGGALAARLRDAASAVDGAPVVGDDLRGPLDSAAGAADQLISAGRSQVDAVDHLASWLSLAVAAIPILVLAAVYLPRRWRFVRQATAGQRFIDAAEDLDLFALRALGNQPMHRLARISADPAGAWRRSDPEVVRRLAELELAEVGLRPPRT